MKKKTMRMKRSMITIATLTMGMLLSGCGVTANYAGFGRGTSNNEQIASEIADINAAVSAAKANNWTVEEKATVETVDSNGKAQSTYTSEKTAKTSATFTENTFERKIQKNGGTFVATTTFNGNAEVK